MNPAPPVTKILLIPLFAPLLEKNCPALALFFRALCLGVAFDALMPCSLRVLESVMIEILFARERIRNGLIDLLQLTRFAFNRLDGLNSHWRPRQKIRFVITRCI